ncbi:MAG: c-type cytochrome [Rhodocyclaceae bacterium]|nr:c-type cytochrome [Rhodocyclaceae bacterium]MBX3667300.1 c-type cytochrome [Rhodocyclaceae bacterium]
MANNTNSSGWRFGTIRIVLIVLLVLAVLGAYVAWYRFFREEAQPDWVTATPEMRFKYGSIGAERDAGIPYWIFYVLPRIFPDKLPGPGGYAAFGVAWEQGQELPIGFTKKVVGFPRVANNCAVCHTSSYRSKHDENPTFVPTGPTQRLKLEAFFRFLVEVAQDPRFNADTLMGEINQVTKLDLIDRLAYRFFIIPITKQRLAERKEQFAWVFRKDFPEWGPGRDDSMNLTKYFMIKWKMDDSVGPTDMPSIWNIKKYHHEKGMRMNFAGDSHDAFSVIMDSALGLLGAPPKSNAEFVDEVKWLLDYLGSTQAPRYPFAIEEKRAARGKQVFEAECARCHASARTGTRIPLKEIGTDAERIGTWNHKAAKEANRVVRNMGLERLGLVEDEPLDGYIAAFLDGIWLRGPYLHNGSVPTLRDLLEPADKRPKQFYRGYDVYDQARVGFESTSAQAQKYGFPYDTFQRTNSNKGHEFGTRLPGADKDALVEYLKTL